MKKALSFLLSAVLLVSSFAAFYTETPAATRRRVPVCQVGERFTVTLKATKKRDYASAPWDRAYYAKFVPEEDGDYEFHTSSPDFYCEAAYSAMIVNAKDKVISYAYALGEDSFYINIVGHLKAGKPYYYLVHYANQGCSRTVKLKVRIKKHRHQYINTAQACPDAEHMIDYGVDENGNGITMCKVQGCYDDGLGVYYNRGGISTARTAYTYTGSEVQPEPVFTDMRGKPFTPEGWQYKVRYKNNTEVGRARVTVWMDGYPWRSAYFNILPPGTAIKKLTPRKNALTVRWNRQTEQTAGYQIRYATNRSFKRAETVTVKSPEKCARTLKNLKSGKTYYVKVRTYTVKKKHTYYSRWSPASSAVAG